MAIREYTCSACGLVDEIILPISKEPPTERNCPLCGKPSRLVVFSKTHLVTSNFTNNPLDISIGASSEARWKVYLERQDQRNKIRKETGSLGLSEVKTGVFVPISEERKSEREKAEVVIGQQGRPQDPELI